MARSRLRCILSQLIGHTGVVLLCAIMPAACIFDSDNHSKNDESFESISDPQVEEAPDIEPYRLLGAAFDMAVFGYQFREYFTSGEAVSFKNVNELTSDGFWEVEPGESADYKTRISVQRPIDPADFSGVVLIEWLNVYLGFELRPSWTAGHTEFLREGHVWIGVSAQKAGIDGVENPLIPFDLYLKAFNPDRYGSLDHPGDSFSFDIFSQVAQLVRNPTSVDVLEGLQPIAIIAVGNSDSASQLVTYINALQLRYNTFDGYMLHSRGGSGAPLSVVVVVEGGDERWER